MKGKVAGEVAIVTGASAGIGAATARELARRGARVVLAARRSEELQAQVDAIASQGASAVAIQTDMADPKQVTRLVQRTVETFGRVDVVVNNAGIGWWKPMIETSSDEITHLIQVNLLSAMLLTHLVLPGMVGRRHGVIVSIASVAGIVATKPLYSATKFGIRGFSLGLRRQLVGSGVSVCLVAPGNIRTAMTNGLAERMPGPEIVANTVADLIVHPRREVIVPVKHHAVVWVEQFLPPVADLIFNWRHRNDSRDWMTPPVPLRSADGIRQRVRP